MKKYLKVFENQNPIIIHHIECYSDAADTETEVYNTNKLTVLLSDGLMAVLQGKFIGGKKGDILFFNPSEVHFGRFLRSGEHNFIEFYFPVEILQEFGFCCNGVSQIFENATDRINCIRPTPQDAVKIIDLAQKAACLADGGNEQDEFELFSVILQILGLTANLYTSQKQSALASPVVPQVTKAAEYIAQNFSQKITLADIAKAAGCSVTYLSRQFKIFTGVTVYSYLTQQRIDYSAALLRSGKSVSQACYLSGFDDCSGFIQTFKKYYKITPHKYKKEVF